MNTTSLSISIDSHFAEVIARLRAAGIEGGIFLSVATYHSYSDTVTIKHKIKTDEMDIEGSDLNELANMVIAVRQSNKAPPRCVSILALPGPSSDSADDADVEDVPF